VRPAPGSAESRICSGAAVPGVLAMAKGQQRSNKEAKKPKKTAALGKPVQPIAVMPSITTAIIERGKKKNK
jgi:hypothetical protein